MTETCTLAPAVSLPSCRPLVQRTLKHPRVMHYNRLIALVTAANIGCAVYGASVARWWTSLGTDLRAIAMVAQLNLAVAGTLWYLVLVVSLIFDAGAVSHGHTVVIVSIVMMFAVMVVMALPRLRAAQHDRFEVTHRFCGWVALVLVWVNTMLFVDIHRGDRSFVAALLAAPSFWLIALTAGLAMWPWLLLRRVPVSHERPSSHP